MGNKPNTTIQYSVFLKKKKLKKSLLVFCTVITLIANAVSDMDDFRLIIMNIGQLNFQENTQESHEFSSCMEERFCDGMKTL